LKKPNVESDPLPQEVYVRLAKIGNEAAAGARLKHSQTAHHGKTRLPRDAKRLPFVQEDEVRWETLGQQYGAALASAEAMARLLQ
jgi:hypothetical protein